MNYNSKNNRMFTGKLTVEQVQELKDYHYKYVVIERNGHEHMSFYFEEHERGEYEKEICKAIEQNVLISYGARFMAR